MKKLLLCLFSSSILLAACGRQNDFTAVPLAETASVQDSSSIPDYLLNIILPPSERNKGQIHRLLRDEDRPAFNIAKGMKWEYSFELNSANRARINDKITLEITGLNGETGKASLKGKFGVQKINFDTVDFWPEMWEQIIKLTEKKFSLNPMSSVGCAGSPDTHIDCGFVFDVTVPFGSFKASEINITDLIKIVGDPSNGGPIDIISNDPFTRATVFQTREAGLVKMDGAATRKADDAVVRTFSLNLLNFKR
jgi:hypothetical protein